MKEKAVSRGGAEAQRETTRKPHTENTEGTESHREQPFFAVLPL
jgi:hypothetical protein